MKQHGWLAHVDGIAIDELFEMKQHFTMASFLGRVVVVIVVVIDVASRSPTLCPRSDLQRPERSAQG